jgi:retron-type reverse transcriptase
MKRSGNLLDAIADRDNLRLAFSKALRGKRQQPEVRRFAADMERELDRLAQELRAGTISIGRFRQFVIFDPKERIITAPCFRERVLHHAIMNVCEPHFDRWLIADSFACRTGKGRITALARTRQFAGRFDWFLKFDVRKYFDSVSHERLLDRSANRNRNKPANRNNNLGFRVALAPP